MIPTAETSIISGSKLEGSGDERTLLSVQTAMSSVRMGKPFLIADEGKFHFCLGIDGVQDSVLAEFLGYSLGRSPLLILSAERSDALGLNNNAPISMSLRPNDSAASLQAIASSHPAKINRRPVFEQPEADAAMSLMMKTKYLPACLFYSDISNASALIAAGVPVVSDEAIKEFDNAKVRSLRRKSEAPIPVRGGIQTRMVVFQYSTGETEIGLMVGQPDLKKELSIRIHSACATGDIFGSERCDCGDQLRLAIERLHEMGGGAVLYLDQEGRGIGLVNKIRAYDLQDQSLDTVDANRTLGFADDMRDYAVAAAMVRALGWQAVSILTNNPKKVNALKEQGLEVVERLAHQAPMNENNSHYLKTKARRSGHMLKYK